METFTTLGAVFGLVGLAGAWAYARSRLPHARLASDGVQEARIVVRDRYRPAVVAARRGVPLRLKFVRDEDNPCSQKVILPDFGISRTLPAHRTTTIEVTPDREGEFLFTCEMGMYQGTLVVTGRRRILGRPGPQGDVRMEPR